MRSIALGCACVLAMFHQPIVSADTATRVQTNGQLLALCRADAEECRRQAEHQGRVTAISLKLLGVQTGQCIADIPENISAEVLADTGLFYIRYSGIGEGEDLGYSFMLAFTKKYPCAKQ
jgi:hypothetical protein